MTNENNTGIKNSGDCNTGHRNSGNYNTGHWNSGNYNTGHWNSGDCNAGHWNSGNWNSGNCNSGYFNTNSPDKVRIFNTWVDMTHEEFNAKYNIYADIPLNRWVGIKDIENPTTAQTQMGGYLKTLNFKEACQIWWKENPNRHKDFLELPAFNADIFKEITGIDVEAKDDKMEEAIMTISGKEYQVKIIKELK